MRPSNQTFLFIYGFPPIHAVSSVSHCSWFDLPNITRWQFKFQVSQWYCIQPHITSFLLDPDILLITFLSHTLNPILSSRVRGQVSHSCKRTEKYSFMSFNLSAVLHTVLDLFTCCWCKSVAVKLVYCAVRNYFSLHFNEHLPYQKLFKIKDVGFHEFHDLVGAMILFLEWPQYDTSTVTTKHLWQVEVE
jgi:hypothetical protein